MGTCTYTFCPVEEGDVCHVDSSQACAGSLCGEYGDYENDEFDDLPPAEDLIWHL